MFDRLVEDFCQFDDFCQAFGPHWEARLLSQEAQPAKKRGPQAGLVDSEIMTILVLYHSSRFRNFKVYRPRFLGHRIEAYAALAAG
jgi:hypothetical protein